MALVTRSWKLTQRVIWVCSDLEIARVARIAIRGHRLEFAISRALMARIAVHRRVCPGQREPIVVLLHLLNRDLPAANGVALLAVRSQLALVNVGVAVLAAQPHVAEHRLHVTLCAGNGLMHASQRVASLIVIELRNGADGSPCICRVAVLTGNIQVPVRTVRAFVGLRLRASRNSGKRQEQHRHQIEHTSRR